MDEDKLTLARVETQIENLTKLVEQLRTDLHSGTVGRAEYEEHNKLVDTRLDALEDSKAPWWSVVAVIVAAGMLLWNLAQPLVQMILAN